jgi:hypothetical protein
MSVPEGGRASLTSDSRHFGGLDIPSRWALYERVTAKTRTAALVALMLGTTLALTGCAVLAELWPGAYREVDTAAAELQFSDFGELEIDVHYNGLAPSGAIREQVVAGADIEELAERLDEVGYSVVADLPDEQVWSKGDVTVFINPVDEGDEIVVGADHHVLESDGVRVGIS